jgi:cytochrome c553
VHAARLGRRALALGLLAAACQSPTPPPPGASGATIYALQLCANCHGEAGQGTWRGPPLSGLSAHWTRDELAEFFAAPERWAGSGRLAELAQRFPRPMDSYAALAPDERRRLADWVLCL